ncbi:hypothetical protein ABTZ58_03770 [Streptomyces sp. NPDC094143]|uniref:hypothetical protein n=1 Tax=unclassified Streptomyces TaxID=2593676 RepID=UPI0033302370
MPERTDHHTPEHDPRACNLCSTYRHPALAAQGRALAKHLAEHPLPVQQTGAGR